MIIAAFSQWRTISIFHLFICSNLASTVPIISPTVTGIIARPSNRLMLQRAFFIFFLILRISLSAYLIHRFRFWANTPGQCFVLPPESLDGQNSTVELLMFGAVLSVIFQSVEVALSIKTAVAESRRHGIKKTLQEHLKDWKRRPAGIRRLRTFNHVSDLFFDHVVSLIWNIWWTVRVILANHSHVLGDEYTFTFGQVGALVVFVASFYAIANSYIRKRWAASW